MQRRRGASFPAECIDRAKALALAGQTPTQIQRLLRPWDPALSTVKLWVRDVAPVTDAPWDPVVDATPEQCGDLAPMLTFGSWPKKSEASWMLRVQAWAPRLPADRVWMLGRYIASSTVDDQHRLIRSLLTGAVGVDGGTSAQASAHDPSVAAISGAPKGVKR